MDGIGRNMDLILAKFQSDWTLHAVVLQSHNIRNDANLIQTDNGFLKFIIIESCAYAM